jgi:D-serine dehydratase
VREFLGFLADIAGALGPSHPCTTFDKWREVHLVDDAYTVIETVPTYF